MRSEWTRQVDVRVLKVSGLLITMGLLLRVKIYQEWPLILEGGLYVGGLLLLASYKPVRQMMQAIPRPQQRFLICLVGLMLLAQIWGDPQKTFPFIPWAMYMHENPIRHSILSTLGFAGTAVRFKYLPNACFDRKSEG